MPLIEDAYYERMVKEANRVALASMTDEERASLDRILDQAKRRGFILDNANIRLGRETMLEILAAIGRYAVQHNVE